MKKKILLPIIFLALGALVGCGGPSSESTESVESTESTESVESTESTTNTYVWSISNEAALTAEWHVGDADRQIEITSEPAVNLTTLLTNDEAWITSSDTSVIGVQGTYLKALGAGTSTVTLEFDNQTDSVTIEVLPLVENVQTIAEAFALSTGPDNKDQPQVTIKAVVTHILGSAAMIADGTGFMYVYDSGFTSQVEAGDYVKVTGTIDQYDYYTPQLKKVASVEILTETAPTIDLTPVTLTAAEWDEFFSGESYTAYVEGYATVYKDGSYVNFNYHETEDGAKASLPGSVRGYADGANFCADACVSGVYKFKGYLYGTSAEADTNDPTVINRYRQNLYATEYVEVKAPSVSIPEPKTITVTTLAEAIDNPAEELKQKFHIDGVTVSKLGQKDTDTSADIYGNIWVTDGTTDILSYGATATATALSWSEAAGAYSYKNPQDFASNDLTKDIAVGDTLNIDFVVTSFKGTKQINSIITAVNGTATGGEGEGEGDNPTPTEMTIAEALAAADGTQVIVSGIVKTTDSWNTEHSNMSVTIIDTELNELYVYRLGTKVAVGDDITVTGTMTTYNDARQIAQGATAVINSSGNKVPGAVDESEVLAKFSFSEATQVSCTTEQQVYSHNGITVTNDKASSTTAIRNHKTEGDGSFRFYKGSNFTIEYSESFSAVVIDYDGSKYVLPAGEYGDVEATLQGTTGTLTLAAAATSVTITGMPQQVRALNISLIA